MSFDRSPTSSQFEASGTELEEVREQIIDLYLDVKIRSTDEVSPID